MLNIVLSATLAEISNIRTIDGILLEMIAHHADEIFSQIYCKFITAISNAYLFSKYFVLIKQIY